MVVGRLYWAGNFSAATLNFVRVIILQIQKFKYKNKSIFHWTMGIYSPNQLQQISTNTNFTSGMFPGSPWLHNNIETSDEFQVRLATQKSTTSDGVRSDVYFFKDKSVGNSPFTPPKFNMEP